MPKKGKSKKKKNRNLKVYFPLKFNFTCRFMVILCIKYFIANRLKKIASTFENKKRLRICPLNIQHFTHGLRISNIFERMLPFFPNIFFSLSFLFRDFATGQSKIIRLFYKVSSLITSFRYCSVKLFFPGKVSRYLKSLSLPKRMNNDGMGRVFQH